MDQAYQLGFAAGEAGPQSGLETNRATDGANRPRRTNDMTIDDQFDGQAAEHARLCALHDAEADRIADEIIDKILRKGTVGGVELPRESPRPVERALMAAAARIVESGTVETGSLPAVRHALALRKIGVPVALTLAYQAGVDCGRGRRGGCRRNGGRAYERLARLFPAARRVRVTP